MKRLSKWILIVLCLCLLALPAAGVSGAESVQTAVSVEQDGSCFVVLRLQLRLEQEEELSLSLPPDAKDVRLNGSYRTPDTQGQTLVLPLPELGPGIHTVEVSFRLEKALSEQNGVLWLEVPLLSGFSYPVEAFTCTVTLPGEPAQKPSFVSGYYGESIAASLRVDIQGNSILCRSTQSLKDRETLTMKLRADRDMFPEFSAEEPLLDGWEWTVAILLGLGLVYYLVALLPAFPKKIRSFSPPEGLAAGDLGTCLTGCGMDLTMMVFSWAQLGYLTIETDGKGKVSLLRRMEMGSERSVFENKCFQALFSRGQRVDGSSLHYALLYRKMAGKSPLLRQIYRSRSGNPKILRVLLLAAGACSGVLLSRGVYSAGAGTVLLALAMVLICAVLSFGIHAGIRAMPLGNKLPLRMWLLCVGVWLALGLMMGGVTTAVGMVLCQSLGGLAAAVGGRRSEVGGQYVAQIKGLRQHLMRGSVFDLQQCLERNPAYFFEMMPYALALGVEKGFARRFGKVKLAECSYLSAPVEELTPYQWAVLLRQVADCLNRRQRRLKFEQLLQTAENMVKSK